MKTNISLDAGWNQEVNSTIYEFTNKVSPGALKYLPGELFDLTLPLIAYCKRVDPVSSWCTKHNGTMGPAPTESQVQNKEKG